MALADEALRGSVEPHEISAALRSFRGCPNRSEELAERLMSLGLYEDVVRLALSGCRVPPSALRAARAGLMALGAAKWEAEASRLLGEAPRLSGSSRLMVVACAGAGVEIMIDGVTSRLPPPGSSWRAPPPEELIDQILELASPRVALRWGDCTSVGADVRLLASIAFPEVPPSIAALAYGLEVSPSAPLTSIVLRIALESVRVLERGKAEWDLLPEALRAARNLLEVGEAESWAAPSTAGLGRAKGITVTDRPRVTAPVWRPVRLGTREPHDPLLRTALRSIRARGGDVVRAYMLSRSGVNPLGAALADAIREVAEVNESLPAQGQQVEPWDLELVEEDPQQASYDCLRPGCSGPYDARVVEMEEELLRAVGLTPRRNKAMRFQATAADQARGPRVKAYGRAPGPGLSGLAEALGAALAMLNGASRGLLVVPSRALKRALLRSGLGLVDATSDPDSWLLGGLAVVTWDEALSMPYLPAVAESVVVMFPERLLPRGERAPSTCEEAVSQALALLRSLGASAVSRLLPACSSQQDGVELVDPGASPARYKVVAEDLETETEEIFSRLWGGLKLRPYQLAAVKVMAMMVASGRPTAEVIILPTGAGKSAIFQSLAVAMSDMGLGSSALVISPLRALMHDQVEGATRRGLRAAYIDSSVSGSRRRELVRLARAGVLDLLYVTPEGFNLGPGGELMEAGPTLLVLDEAHSVSRWGLSFRPSYLYMASEVVKLRRDGWPPVIALTASAPPDVVDDLMELLDYPRGQYDQYRLQMASGDEKTVSYSGRPVVMRAPSLRPEISVDVVPAPSGPERLEVAIGLASQLISWADSQGGRWIGIAFVPFVDSSSMSWLNAKEVADRVKTALGVEAVYYHGQLSDGERRRLERAIYRSSRTGSGPKVVVATKAFGMGVDIPNIRWTLHLMPSDSIEDLYQEIGRAGRDGRPSRAVVLYNPEDLRVRASMASSSSVSPLGVLRLHNRVARAFESVRGNLVVLPLPKGSPWGLVKYADVLRASGIIDYEIIRGELATYSKGRRAVEEVLGWCVELRGGRCVALRSRELEADGEAYINECPDGSIAYSSSPISGCDSSPLRGPLMLVYAPRRPRPLRYLDPETFVTALWISRRERAKVEELGRVLDEVVAARARGGPAAADSKFKELVDRALATGLRPPENAPKLGKAVECETLAECADQAARLAAEIEASVGEGSVTVVGSSKAIAEVSARYLRLSGRALGYSPSAHRKALRLAREGRLEELMNMGYVLFVARRSQRLENIVEGLREYPYAQLFLYMST